MHRYQITFYIIVVNTSFGINGWVFRFHNGILSSKCKESVFLVLTKTRYLSMKIDILLLSVSVVRAVIGWRLTKSLKNAFLMLLEIKLNGNYIFLKKFFAPFAPVLR